MQFARICPGGPGEVRRESDEGPGQGSEERGRNREECGEHTAGRYVAVHH